MKNACPCCSQKEFADCCGRFIIHHDIPNTPEELMRSRYTAYTLARIDYIEATMLPPASNDFSPDEAHHWARSVKWEKLTVHQTSINGDEGTVEFTAFFFNGKRRETLHEKSLFRRQEDRWFYYDSAS
jgi:SEC-C motif domain protein